MTTQEFESQLCSGYLSFSRADIEKSMAEGTSNVAAYQLMLEATKTNESYTVKGKAVNEIYPLTKEAVETMEKLLDEVEQAADNPQDATFRNRLQELKRVAEWSGSRKKQFSFKVILGGILWILFFYMTPKVLSGPDYSKLVADVKAWSDTPPSYTMEEAQRVSLIYKYLRGSATDFKLFRQKPLIEEYNRTETEYGREADRLKYYNLTDEEKEQCRRSMQVYKARMDALMAEYNENDAKGLEDWRQIALDELSVDIDNESDFKRKFAGLIAYFVIIIILYILTNIPHGYMLSRQRTTARVMGGIQAKLFSIVTWLGISGARMGWTDPDKIVTVYWSDGTISKHLIVSDLINGSLLFKAMFYVLALVVFMYLSAYLLPIITIIGLFINIDRRKLFSGKD